MGIKYVTKCLLSGICILIFQNVIAQKSIKFVWYDSQIKELKIETIIDTISIDFINYIEILDFKEFTKEEVKLRQLKVKEEEKLRKITIYDTNDLFDIILVEKLNNESIIIYKGKYMEILD